MKNKLHLLRLRDELYLYSLVFLSRQQVKEHEVIESVIDLLFTLVILKGGYLAKYDNTIVMNNADAESIYKDVITYLTYLSEEHEFLLKSTGLNHFIQNK